MAHRSIKALSLVLCGLLLASALLPGLTGSARALHYEGSEQYMSGKFYRALCQVELTGDQRVDIVNVALSQLGYQEGGSWAILSGEVYGGVNYTEFGHWYGMQDMWCAMFVSWCAYVAGVSTEVIPKHAYTPDGLRWFRNRELSWSQEQLAAGEYTPRAGDLIYFRSSRNQNRTNHVGLVTGCANGIIYTIEGNISSVSQYTNGGMVAAHRYNVNNPYIVAVCSPNYAQTGANVLPFDPADSLRQAVLQAEGAGYSRVSTAESVCVGIGQWYGNRARNLLKQIRVTDPDSFAVLDTAGIGDDLELDWQTYRPDPEKLACLASILDSGTGRSVQDALLDRQLSDYLSCAEELGITELKGQATYALIRHLAGAQGAARVMAACDSLTAAAMVAALEESGLSHLTRLVSVL